MKIFTFTLSCEGVSFTVFTGDAFVSGRGEWSSVRHANADAEIHLIAAGSAAVSVGDERVTLSRGDILLLAPGVYHAPYAGEGLERFTLAFSAQPGLSLPPYSVIADRFSGAELLSCAAEELRREDWGAGVAARQLISLFFIRLLREVMPGRTEEDEQSAENRKGIIELHFEHSFSRYGAQEELCRELHISRRQLSRVMREYYGMSYRERLAQVRMEIAGESLKNGESVSNIALRLGYESPSSFCGAFKAYYGCTPREFRTRGRE